MTYLIFICATILIGIALFKKPAWLFALLSAAGYGYFFYLLNPNFDLMTYLVWLLGILLIILEIYIPDFGIVGLVGTTACLYSLFTYAGDWSSTIIFILIGIVTIGLTIYLLVKTGNTLVVSPNLVLQDTINTTPHRQSDEADQKLEIGNVGIAVTDLRPVGQVDFAGEIVEVRSQTKFISVNRQVVITEIVNQRIYVKEG